jgi:hypothetical protein
MPQKEYSLEQNEHVLMLPWQSKAKYTYRSCILSFGRSFQNQTKNVPLSCKLLHN